MKTLIFSIIISSLFTSNAWAYRLQDVRILEECEWNKELFDLKADCNDLFHHYMPENESHSPNSTDVRLGSFNIYKMGSGESKFKRLDLIAQMMNKRWDVVALSEVQHNASDKLKYNANAMRALDKGEIDKATAQKGYRKPDYLRLLHELQKMDKSWGLIVAPFGQNPSSKSSQDELYAFLYRMKQVKPMASKYCEQHLNERLQRDDGKLTLLNWMTLDVSKGVKRIKPDKPANTDFSFKKPETDAVACIMNVKDDEQKYFPRIPLVASFQSGNFDFNYVSLHLRFHEPDKVLGKCEDACKETLEKMAKIAGAPEHFDVKALKAKPSDQEPRLSGDDLKYIARQFETYVTLKESIKIRNVTNDNDIIITGDFNLPTFEIPASNVTPDLNGTSGKLISVLDNLPDSIALIDEKTSISKKFGVEGKPQPDGSFKGGGNKYDHLILVDKEGFSSECNVESAQRVDFVADPSVKNQMLIHGQPYDEYYKDPNNFDDIIQETLDLFFEDRVLVDSDGRAIETSEMDPTTADESLFEDYNNCITGERKQEMTLAEGLAMDLRCQLIWHSELANEPMLSKPDKPKVKEKYRIYTGTISDHLPVEITCSSSASDDD